MFFGHIGVGLASKRVVPDVPNGVLIAVALTPDILAVPFIIFKFPQLDSVSLTHGLFMSAVWSALAMLAAAVISRNPRTGAVMGLLVISHWVLDFVSWPLDFGRGLPLLLNRSPEVGLGLYRTTAGSIAGEAIGLLFVGVMIYIRIRNQRVAKHRKMNT